METAYHARTNVEEAMRRLLEAVAEVRAQNARVLHGAPAADVSATGVARPGRPHSVDAHAQGARR